MFATSQPVKIVVNRRPEMSDAEFADQEVRRFSGSSMYLRATYSCNLHA